MNYSSMQKICGGQYSTSEPYTCYGCYSDSNVPIWIPSFSGSMYPGYFPTPVPMDYPSFGGE